VNWRGQDYLLLADSDLDNLDETGLSLTNLVRLLFLSDVGKVILLLDVDRSFSSDEVSSLEQQLSQKLSSDRGLIIFYASSPEQGAYEIDVLQQGTFTYALREALLSTQGNLSLERLEQFLRERVTELNDRYDRPTQTPQSFIFPTNLQKWIPFPSNLQVFEFKTPTVNRRGEIIQQDTKLAQSYTEDLGNGITLNLVAIPGGNFMMGSPEGEGNSSEKPQHEVTVPPFFMGKYPITQAQWRAIASLPKVERELNPSPSRFQGNDRPVEQVSWYDAVEFCARLSKLTGKEYRLPSEAEWEYACRALTTTPFYFGETIATELANYNGKYTYTSYAWEATGVNRQETTPVGTFPPNAFGLYDLHGNVWEWCADDWHENYKGAPDDGSAWLDKNNNRSQKKREKRSPLRGGSWHGNPSICRSACRSNNAWRGNIDYNVGFRVVCGGGRTVWVPKRRREVERDRERDWEKDWERYRRDRERDWEKDWERYRGDGDEIDEGLATDWFEEE
jgi:formylglycine-generating enzyme required for sulfatase activity